jgi:iron complex outermembrane receptor protein
MGVEASDAQRTGAPSGLEVSCRIGHTSRMRSSWGWWVAIASATSGVAASHGASAADGADSNKNREVQVLPPVVVTGQAPDGVGQASTLAWSLLDGAEIRPGAARAVRDLPSLAPNLRVFDSNNDRAPRFSLRGLRENNFATGEPAVGLYIDGVPYTDLASRGAPLFDLGRVEFLRGPQGTILGAAGPAGTVIATSRQPGNVWEGEASLMVGNYDAWEVDAAARGPVVRDKLAFGVSGIFADRDGYVENLVTGDGIDDHETLAGRVQLRWTPSEPWDISFSLSALRFRDGFVPTYYAAMDANLFDVRRDEAGFVDTDENLQALRIAYEAEGFQVVSTTSRRDWTQELTQDFDFSPFPARLGFNNPDVLQWSQELRLQSPDDADRFRWVAGFFFSDRESRNDSGSVEFTDLPGLPPGPNTFRTLSELDARTWAGFGQATYTLWDRLDVVAGFRGTFDTREARRDRRLENPLIPGGVQPLSEFQAEDDFSASQPRVGLAYRFTEDAEVYFNYAIGYQSGGFNTANDRPEDARYSPARSQHFEIGAKTAWWDERLLVDAALFYVETEGYHVHRIGQFDPAQSFLVNADRARSYGAEVEITARPHKALDLYANVGWTEAEYDEFTDPVTGASWDGNRISFVPRFTAGAGAHLRLPWDLYLRAEAQGVGNFELTEANDVEQESYALLHARLGWRRERWEVAVFARNMLDEEYVNNALDLRNAFQPDLIVLQPGDPLTYGFVVTGRF